MKIFSGRNNQQLTKRICDILQNQVGNSKVITLGKLKIDKFSDGEILPLFNESVRDEDVFFIQTTNTSDNIMETLLVIDAAKRAGCKSFTLIAPFQGYSRQDKTDHLRSSIGSKVLADILEKYEGQTVVVVSHVMPIRGFLKSAMQAGWPSYWRISVAPCSMSIVRFWGNEAAEITVVNQTKHL